MELEEQDRNQQERYAEADRALGMIENKEIKMRLLELQSSLYTQMLQETLQGSQEGSNTETEQQLRALKVFNECKRLAQAESERLLGIINIVLDKYAAAVERMKFLAQISDINTTGVRQATPWSIAGDDDANRVNALLARAQWFEPQFRSAMESFVLFFNKAENMSNIIDEYGLSPDQFNLGLRSSLILDYENPTLLVRGLFGPPKSFDRAMTKFRSGKNLKDLNRITLEVEDPYVMALLYSAIAKRFTIVGVINKNFPKNVFGKVVFTQPPVLHLNVEVDGWVCEIQCIFRDVFLVEI